MPVKFIGISSHCSTRKQSEHQILCKDIAILSTTFLNAAETRLKCSWVTIKKIKLKYNKTKHKLLYINTK